MERTDSVHVQHGTCSDVSSSTSYLGLQVERFANTSGRLTEHSSSQSLVLMVRRVAWVPVSAVVLAVACVAFVPVDYKYPPDGTSSVSE